MEDSMDIDIDLGDGIDYGTAAGEIMTMEPSAPAASEAPQLIEDKDIPDAYKEDFDADFPAKDKIHITGLDGVAEPVILQFVEEHVPDKKVKRLQWIDDSSANIIFYKNEDAAEALGRLSVVQDTAPPPSQLRPAKTFNARPDLQFQIRQALVSDKKKPGAKDRSAFYLFNPEYDPENRRYDKRYDRRDNRRGRGGGGRYEDRYDRPDARRRKPVEKKTFTEDMYDDAPAGQTADEGELFRRMSVTSLSSGEHNRRRQSYEDIDLFDKPKRSDYGRLRDRSRSPVREDGDGRYGFSEQPARQRGRRRRSWTPPNERPPREARKDRKELFPDRAPPSAETPLSNGNRGLELFPNHSAKRSRELFPHKTQHSNHRRSDALDRAESVQILTPKRSLADRISGGPDGRGHSQPAEDTGFSVKGAGGFSVRGAARDINPKVKELFPDKVPSSGNMGKELFPGARGGPRRRAEDLFD